MDTLDVKGLPAEKINELQRIIDQWRKEVLVIQNREADLEDHLSPAKQKSDVQPLQKRKVDPSEFIVKKSHVIGGKVTRAMAYEDE